MANSYSVSFRAMGGREDIAMESCKITASKDELN